MKFRFRKRLIKKHTDDDFHAIYKQHEIVIVREHLRSSKGFYISVTAPNGCYAYDGWWGEQGDSMTDAIEQALKGSCLI